MHRTDRWRFGAVEVDAREHRLTKDGLAVPLTHKALALLTTLLRRPGELVTKSELFDTVWPGVVVSDAALSRVIHELRVALGDSAGDPRCIATVHGLGFRFIAPLSPRHEPAAASALIGRDAELARLRSAFAAACLGRRQTVFVSGEAGIGKTALVEHFVAEAGDAAGPVWLLQGRCIEQYGPGDAYLPVLEALEQAARQAGAERFVELFARYAPSWLAQLPWLAGDGARLLRGRAGDSTPHGMLRELAHALEVLSQQALLVLWLEDLHWSDPSSLEVLSFLAGRREPARLLVIGSLRPTDPGASALERTVLTLVQRNQAEELGLRLLSCSEVARWLGRRFGSPDAKVIDPWASFIHRRTEGNPLFTVAVVEDLVRRGELIDADGRWLPLGAGAERDDRLPDSLRRLVHEQVERLGETDRRLVEAAAVAGPDFCAAAAAAAAGGDDAEDRCLALARKGGLLEQQAAVSWPDGTVSAGLRFRHALYWQVVYELVPEGRRAQWQRRIGLRQEQAWGAQSAAIASELAMRFEAAHDVERSLHHLLRAASAALSRCAYRECIDRLRHGLDLASRLPTPQRARHELDLLLPLGAALVASQGYASSDVEAVYRRALALCSDCGQPPDVARALRGLWNVAFLRADLTLAQQAAEQLLAQAEVLAEPRARVDARTKLGQTWLHQGKLHEARQHLEAALAAARASGDSTLLREAPRVAADLAWALWYGGEPAQAARMGDTALELARRADSPHSTVFTLSHVGWVRLMRGDVEVVRPLLDEQHALSRQYGFSYWRHYCDAVSGVLVLRQGALPEGIAALQQATDAMQALGDRIGVPHLLCLLAQAQLAAGLAGPARRSVDAALRGLPGSAALHAAEARRVEGLVAQAEDSGPAGRAAARRGFELALEIARSQGARALELRAATSLARLLADEGDVRLAVESLSGVRSGFAEGFDTEDLARADALLATLREHAGSQPPRVRSRAGR